LSEKESYHMLRFQNSLLQGSASMNPNPLVQQSITQNNMLLNQLLIQTNLLNMNKNNLLSSLSQLPVSKPEKKVRTDDLNLNMLATTLNSTDVSTTNVEESQSSKSHTSPSQGNLSGFNQNIKVGATSNQLSPLLSGSPNSEEQTAQSLSNVEIKPKSGEVGFRRNKATLSPPKESQASSPIIQIPNEKEKNKSESPKTTISQEKDTVNKKRSRRDILEDSDDEEEGEPQHSLDPEENARLEQIKKEEELEIKNLIEQYNELIAEKKRKKKLKRKEAPKKKGRLRRLVDQENYFEEINTHSNSNNQDQQNEQDNNSIQEENIVEKEESAT